METPEQEGGGRDTLASERRDELMPGGLDAAVRRAGGTQDLWVQLLSHLLPVLQGEGALKLSFILKMGGNGG